MQEKELDLPKGGKSSANNGRSRAAESPDPENGDGKPEFKVFDRRFWQQQDSDEDGGKEQRAEVPSYVQQLKDQLAEKDNQLREYIAAYKKEVVEGLEQSKERLERDAEQRVSQIRGEMAAPMMEVLEALERSLEAARSTNEVQSMLQGIEMVTMLMVQKLKELGLERIETVGQPFDPQVHEAVAVAAADSQQQDNTILAEFSPGFRLDGRVIRAAKVQVAKLSG